MTSRLTNWAGNVTYTPTDVHRPSTVDELRKTVASAPRVKALGSRHSFSRVADTPGTLVSVDGLPPVVDLDTERRTVRVAAGLRYGEVAAALQPAGHALHNLGSLPHISVGGAVATGTHGSGDGVRCLAGAVRGLEMVTATGDLVTLERGVDADFPGAVVALGALGVVTALTLDVEPTYDVAQHVYDGIALATLRDSADEVFASGDSRERLHRLGQPLGQPGVAEAAGRTGRDPSPR
jgi:xylitol oxidase